MGLTSVGVAVNPCIRRIFGPLAFNRKGSAPGIIGNCFFSLMYSQTIDKFLSYSFIEHKKDYWIINYETTLLFHSGFSLETPMVLKVGAVIVTLLVLPHRSRTRTSLCSSLSSIWETFDFE